MSKNIIFVAYTQFPYCGGGREKIFSEMLSRMRHYDVTFIKVKLKNDDQMKPVYDVPDNVNFISLKTLQSLSNNRYINSIQWSPVIRNYTFRHNMEKFQREANNILRKMSDGSAIGWHLGIETLAMDGSNLYKIARLSGNWSLEVYNDLTMLKGWALEKEEKSISIPDKIVVSSTAQAKEKHLNNFTVVHSGLDQRFQPLDGTEMRKKIQTEFRFDIRDDDFVICQVGSLRRLKGHRYLLEAISKIPEGIKEKIKIIIIGKGDTRELERLARNYKIKVLFTGWREDVEVFLNASNICANLSVSEGESLVVREAFACGIPVLCTSVGVMSEEVGDAGYLVPFGDIPRIKGGIEYMMNNYESYKKLALGKSQEVRSKYSWDTMVQQFEKLWM